MPYKTKRMSVLYENQKTMFSCFVAYCMVQIMHLLGITTEHIKEDNKSEKTTINFTL